MSAQTGKAATSVVLMSSDSHVSDFPHLWNGPVVEKFGSRAMHEASGGGSSSHGISPRGMFGDWVVGEGIVPFPTSGGNVGGFPFEGRPQRLDNFDCRRDAPKGATDPTARLQEMTNDGLQAEFVTGTYGLRIPTMRSAELQRACARASNTWVADFCKAAPNRLLGAGGISLADMTAAVADLRHAVDVGLRAVYVSPVAPLERSYASRFYDPFWAAAAEAGMPVMLHAIPPPELAALSHRRRPAFHESEAQAVIEDYHLANVLYDHPIQVTLAQMLLGGVLERHPKLRLVLAEWGAGWVPNLLDGLDWTYGSRPAGLDLKMPPSEYVLRQVWMTFDRPLGLPMKQVERFQDRLMFSSDYPHIESSFPESRRIFAANTGDEVPEAIKTKLAHANFASLFGVPVG